ncbi:MAG: mandelate racemase/muconate lactonizing enzyme family protein, partial [bacterium]
MRVTAIETILIDEFPNLLWVQVHTDEGLSGLGETFFGVHSAEAHVHAVIAPYLLGLDPLPVDRHTANMVGYVGFHGSSAEQRGRSAVDIALWDLWGKATGQPLCQLLGGTVRDDIRAYNTCAGNRYALENPVHDSANFGLNAKGKQYEDLDAFLHRADELAHSLLEMGITAMKIWPFDFAAEASHGTYISPAELDTALEPFRKIRAAVGDKMEVMAELHALWNLPMAKKVCAALEEFEPLWVEDPVFLDQLGSIGEVQAATGPMIATGETLGGRGQFLELLQGGGCGMAIMDVAWCGGISEARKAAAMAEAFHVSVAFHDCTGPVTLAASTHLALNSRNCFIQELVRAYYYGWYAELATALPPLNEGRLSLPDGPGLGL